MKTVSKEKRPRFDYAEGEWLTIKSTMEALPKLAASQTKHASHYLNSARHNLTFSAQRYMDRMAFRNNRAAPNYPAQEGGKDWMELANACGQLWMRLSKCARSRILYGRLYNTQEDRERAEDLFSRSFSLVRELYKESEDIASRYRQGQDDAMPAYMEPIRSNPKLEYYFAIFQQWERFGGRLGISAPEGA